MRKKTQGEFSPCVFLIREIDFRVLHAEVQRARVTLHEDIDVLAGNTAADVLGDIDGAVDDNARALRNHGGMPGIRSWMLPELVMRPHPLEHS